MPESTVAVSLLAKWIVCGIIGFAAGTISARIIQQIGLFMARRRWEQRKAQASGVQRSKLELERRRLLRSNPSLKLDTSAEVLDTLGDRDRKEQSASWNYFTPGVTTRRLHLQMRLVGIGVGIITTLFAFVVLTLIGF